MSSKARNWNCIAFAKAVRSRPLDNRNGDDVKAVSTHFDKAAIGLSLVCAAHCLLLPVALVILPTLTANSFSDERFHQWMLMAVLPTSLLALAIGCRRHRNLSVIAIGLPGLAILTLTALLGHDWLGESGEKIASLLGASLIALSHFRNHALCRHLQCGCKASSIQLSDSDQGQP